MIKPSHFRYEEKVVLVSILVGMGAWVLDALIDSLVFSQATFLDTLILEITPHELYFRLFLLLVIFLFGVMTSRTLTRRKFVEEELRKA
ncbi:MAG: cph1, partial [Nitrospirae bacterium]|nr:cph1 [Nitrospirota bacterium]